MTQPSMMTRCPKKRTNTPRVVRSSFRIGAVLFSALLLVFANCGTADIEGSASSSRDTAITPIKPESTVPSRGVTYFVATDGHDSYPGTEAQPWRTIQQAADTLVAGDSVYIKAGVYEEQVIPQHSGSAGNYITFAAYPGHSVTIDGTDVPLPDWDSGLFELTGRSYIRVAGLKIQNAGPNLNNAGFLVDSCDHIILESNHTYNTVSSGIGVWSSENIVIDGNEVELGCNDGEQEVITVAGTDTFEIKNNHVHHGGPGTNGGEGIDVKDGSSNGKVFANHVHHMNGDRTCLYVDAWDKPTFNIEVYQNVLHDCGAGISLASENGGRLHSIRVYNNIVYHNRSNGLEIGNWGEPGVPLRPVENVTFINNTVFDNGTAGWGGGMANDNPDAANIVVRNNIFSQNYSFQIADEAGLAGSDFSVDHNLIDSFQDYPGETRGANAVEGDPMFANPGAADFHLRPTSPAIDSGSDVDAPAVDFAGIPRPQDGDGNGSAVHDIGAYEVPLHSAFAFLPCLY